MKKKTITMCAVQALGFFLIAAATEDPPPYEGRYTWVTESHCWGDLYLGKDGKGVLENICTDESDSSKRSTTTSPVTWRKKRSTIVVMLNGKEAFLSLERKPTDYGCGLPKGTKHWALVADEGSESFTDKYSGQLWRAPVPCEIP